MARGGESNRPERYAWGLVLIATGTSACAGLIGADEWTMKEEPPGAGGTSGGSDAAVGAGGQGGAAGAGMGGSSPSAGGGGGAGGAGGGMSASSSGAGGGEVAMCNDGEPNGAETGVDCGGPKCAKCGSCQPCLIDFDCETGCCANSVCVQFNGDVCDPINTCPNGCQDGTETDVDCGGGGSCSIQCGPTKNCIVPTDCAPGLMCNALTLLCEPSP